MKPDLILVWPRSCDFPLWRQFLRENRDRFAAVIIVFSETYYGIDYRNFIRTAMEEDRCSFIDPVPVKAGEDWRHAAVSTGLLYATAEWIWFTEQDFLPTSSQFWLNVDNLKEGYDAFGFIDDGRLHPCCLFIKRDTLFDKTHKRFGVVPDSVDHFGQIQQDLDNQGVKYGSVNKEFCHHMAGLSQNYNLLYRGQEPNFRPEEFKNYLNDCLKAHVDLSLDFTRMVKPYLEKASP